MKYLHSKLIAITKYWVEMTQVTVFVDKDQLEQKVIH